jgi:ribosomal protein S18 acetylase RimI-like enzyme
MLVRLAKPDECNALTALAMRAKASWGYSDDFMAACQLELTMTQAKIAAWTVWVAQSDQTICGMIALHLQPGSDKAEIEEFFVDPNFHGRGIGRTLMSKLLEACFSCGVKAVGLDADPNAEGVYSRFGFTTIGRSPSRSIPGRTLPRMELRLDSALRLAKLVTKLRDNVEFQVGILGQAR